MSSADVRNVRYPFLIRTFSGEISVQQIGVFVQTFPISYISFSSYNRQQIVLIHYSENGFRVVVDAFAFKPDTHSAVSICVPALCLTLSYFFSKGQIFGQGIHPADISVVTATGYFKKTTHFADGILFSVSIYDLVFYADLHSFPVSKRKSRNSSTSIFKRLFSYLYSARAFAGFRPRCFGMPCSSFFLSRVRR